MFEVKCHCGNISLKAKDKPTEVTTCNCSICYRLGALWGYYKKGEVEVNSTIPSVVYQREPKTLLFHTCSICGCNTHYTSDDRVAINTRMAGHEFVQTVRVKRFDGAKTYKYIE